MYRLTAIVKGGATLRCWTKAIQSLSRVGEYIVFDISTDQIVLTVYNSSQSVFALAKFPRIFFEKYAYGRKNKTTNRVIATGTASVASSSMLRSRAHDSSNAVFQLQSKVLLSIFRKIERDNANMLYVKLNLSGEDDETVGQDSGDAENMHSDLTSQLEIEVALASGIKKSYKLSCMNTKKAYPSFFDKSQTPSVLQCEAGLMKRYLDYISSKAKELSISFKQEGCVRLEGLTTGITFDNEILKMPINTKIELNLNEFQKIQTKLGIKVQFKLKEFRIFISLAESFNSKILIEANFYQPGTPMMFEIVGPPSLPNGAQIFFVFLTNGDAVEDESTAPDIIINGNAKLLLEPDDRHDFATVDHDVNELTQDMPTQDVARENRISWDDHEMPLETVTQQSEGLFVDDILDDEEDDDLYIQAMNEYQAIGPTQNMSQAKGLFD